MFSSLMQLRRHDIRYLNNFERICEAPTMHAVGEWRDMG
jgi:hypothetical protein